MNRIPGNESIVPGTAVKKWLITGAIMVYIMVVIGGVTRLTGSGLSMVDWKLIMGSLPPMNEQEWTETFNKYQQFPEFKLKNFDMTLDEFKGIFFWEYLHRMWGRLIGVVFLIPFVIFMLRKKIQGIWKKRIGILFLLGALQGAVGWIMVVSGLQKIPEVSHYRLTLHLFMAMLLLGYILWLLHIRSVEKNGISRVGELAKKGKKLFNWFFYVLLVQIMYGGFMAGKKAAIYYPTYPDMNGEIVPQGLFRDPAFFANFTENVTMIQFIHRLFPLVLLVILILIVRNAVRSLKTIVDIRIVHVVSGFFLMQFLLGVLTVIGSEGKVPVFLGTAHQIIGIGLFAVSLWGVFRFRAYARSNN